MATEKLYKDFTHINKHILKKEINMSLLFSLLVVKIQQPSGIRGRYLNVSFIGNVYRG